MEVAVPEVLKSSSDALGDAPFDELADACEQLHALECAVRWRQLGVVHLLLDSEEWRVDGVSSLDDWLNLRLGVGRAEASELVRVADALRSLPLLGAAFGEGRLSWRKLVLITSFASGPEDDARFAEVGSVTPLSHLKLIARGREEVSEKDVIDAFDGRRFWWRTRNHSIVFSGSLPLDLGAVVTTALDRIADQASYDPTQSQYPPVGHARADALVELAGTRLGADADPDRATVVVEVDAGVLAGQGAGVVDGEGLVPAETVRRLACDARVQVATVRDGNTVGVGRVSRTIAPWLARRLAARDLGCRFPGCTRTRWVHGHHIEHWGDGGPTNLDNLVTLCEVHHHFVHERHWRIEGDPGGTLEFIRPDGRVYLAHCPALRQDTWNLFTEMLERELTTVT